MGGARYDLSARPQASGHYIEGDKYVEVDKGDEGDGRRGGRTFDIHTGSAHRRLRLWRLGPAAVPVERLWIEVHHDVLGLGVEIHGVATQLPAETALLVATEGCLGRVDRRVVDADVAGMQAPRQG